MTATRPANPTPAAIKAHELRERLSRDEKAVDAGRGLSALITGGASFDDVRVIAAANELRAYLERVISPGRAPE